MNPKDILTDAKISEAFGHLVGKNIESMGVKLDIQAVIKGLKDASSGKNSPMTEMECIEAITAAQEAVFKETSTKNLSGSQPRSRRNLCQRQSGRAGLLPGGARSRRTPG